MDKQKPTNDSQPDADTAFRCTGNSDAAAFGHVSILDRFRRVISNSHPRSNKSVARDSRNLLCLGCVREN